MSSSSLKKRSRRKMSTQQISTPTLLRSQPLPYLPQDIITDILSRLPVKTLIRFRCVSKSFLYLILNPHFINTHLLKSSNINNDTHHTLILSSSTLIGRKPRHPYSFEYSSFHSIFYSLYDSTSNYAVELDYPLKDYIGLVWIMGSFNGLVCIVIKNISICIWNPSTRELKELPDLDTSLRLDMLTVCGFGYDQLNDDYKVVWKVPDVSDWVSIENLAIVYSLRTNSWGKIGNFPRAIYCKDAGKYVNGVLHWAIMGSNGFDPDDIIISFDLGSETYGEIAQPNFGDNDFDWSLNILEGCLCICYDRNAIRADLWVMKEYGIRDSWIKLCTIPYTTISFPEYYWMYRDPPSCISITGKILLKFVKNLVLYDPNSGTFTNPSFRNLLSSDFTTYVESLVSPGIYGEVQTPQH